MWNFVTISVLFFVISTDAVNITVTASTEKILSCHQDNELNITAFEGKPLTFSVQSDKPINDTDYIKCTKLDESNLSFVSTIKISKDMGGRWQCVTKFDSCFIKIHVRLKDSSQKVLQHNMVIPTSVTGTNEEYDHFGQAFYTEGDDINITCIVEDNTPVTQNITLKYVCPGHDVVQDQPIVRIATKDCYLLCTYEYQNDFTITKVIFVHMAHDKGGYMKVNGHIARQNWTTQDGFGTETYTPNYIFSNKDKVYISCHTETEGFVFRTNCENKNENDAITYEKEVSTFESTFQCNICRKAKSDEIKIFIVHITKLHQEALVPIKTKAIATTKPPEPAIATPKPSNNGNIIAIVCSVIAVLLIIGIVIYVVNMWKQKRATANNNSQNSIEGIPQTDQQNSVYAEPYDHTRNRPVILTQRNNNTTSSTKQTSATNGQNTKERMPPTEDHRNSVYIDPPKQEDIYAQAVPKDRRSRNTNSTVPKSSYPTEVETSQYANENELAKEALGENIYVNEKEAVIGEGLYDNEENIGKVYDNVCHMQEPFYGNSESSLYFEPTYSESCKKAKN